MSDDEDWNDIFREQGPERARETFNEKIKEGHANDGGKGAPRDEDDDAYDGMLMSSPRAGREPRRRTRTHGRSHRRRNRRRSRSGSRGGS